MDLRNLFELTAWFNLKKTRDNTEELVKQGRENERLRRGYNALKECPWCGAKLPKVNVAICMHCRKELAWVERTPCKPGTERQVSRRLKKELAARKRRAEEKARWEEQWAEEKAKATEAVWNHVFNLAFVIAGLFIFDNILSLLADWKLRFFYPPMTMAGIVGYTLAYVYSGFNKRVANLFCVLGVCGGLIYWLFCIFDGLIDWIF